MIFFDILHRSKTTAVRWAPDRSMCCDRKVPGKCRVLLHWLECRLVPVPPHSVTNRQALRRTVSCGFGFQNDFVEKLLMGLLASTPAVEHTQDIREANNVVPINIGIAAITGAPVGQDVDQVVEVHQIVLVDISWA